MLYWYSHLIQKEKEFERTFPIFQDLSKEYNLVINKKKSGIFFIGQGEIEQKHIHEIPVLDSYRYLGVQLARNGKIFFHVK